MHLKLGTIPSIRFSKTNWLNFPCHHCPSLITNVTLTSEMTRHITKFDKSFRFYK